MQIENTIFDHEVQLIAPTSPTAKRDAVPLYCYFKHLRFTMYNFNLFKYYCPYYNITLEPHCWSKVLDTVGDLLDIVRVC